MHHTDVAMEYYVAEDSRPLDKCLADVAACDLFICVVAWRYGFIPPEFDESITQLEYHQAVASGKPCLAFLLSEDAPWPKNRMETSALDRVEAFRHELSRDLVVAEFTDETDLGRKVGEAIHNWERNQGVADGGDRTDWEMYRRAVFDTHRWVRLAVIAGAKQDRRFAEIPLANVFVTQRVQAGPPEYDVPEDPDVESASPEFLGSVTEPSLGVLAKDRQQVFLGAPGSGKSTLLLDAMLLLCDSDRDPSTLPAGLRDAPLPFLIELRQYVLDPATSFVDYLAASTQRQYGVEIDATSIEAVLAKENRALVMFDGLDEVFDARAQSQVIDEFRAFARSHPNARMVVTSRIAGYRALELERDGFRHYTLLGFGMPEIREFIPKWYTYYTWQGDLRDAAGLIRRISDSPRLLELAANPLLLTMMAVIYKHQDLPEKRWQLYARCTEVLLEDWDIKRKNIDRNELLPLGFAMLADQKAELLQRVSMYMLEQQRPGSELNAIARGPLLTILATYLEDQYRKSPGEARAISAEILNHLRERTYIIAEIGDQLFGFVHRTFMEFFAAEYCKAEFNRREADYEWLTVELFGQRWRLDEWREVLLLLIAMLKDQGSPVRKVIDHLRHEEVLGLPVQLAFAARCLAETGTTDDTWSQTLVHRLVVAICAIARQSDEAASFLDDALGSFSLLAPAVSLSPETRAHIDELARDRSLRGRMVSFQLQLALRSKDERLAYALEALNEPEESVRRGAIAALEREWPANEQVYVALGDVLRTDRLARVRSAALDALDRGWPPGPEILQALEYRATVETAYTFAIEVVDYLTTRWGGDTRAMRIVLGFTQRSELAPQQEVRRAVAHAVKEVWRHSSECQRLLRGMWQEATDPQVATAALVVLAEAWADDSATTGWIRDQLTRKGSRRVVAVEALLRETSESAGWSTWFRRLASKDGDPSLQRVVIRSMPMERGDRVGLSWLEERVLSDSDPMVRNDALNRWATKQVVDLRSRDALLCDRATHDDSWVVRWNALTLLTQHPLGLGRQGFLRSRLVKDRDPRIRQAITHLLTEDTTTEGFLRGRLRLEADASCRAVIMWKLAWIHIGRVPHKDRDQLLDYGGPSRQNPLQSRADRRRLLSTLSDRLRHELTNQLLPVTNLSVRRDLDFLTEIAVNDPDAILRGCALLLMIELAPRDESGWQLVNRRAVDEPDPEVRPLIIALRDLGPAPTQPVV